MFNGMEPEEVGQEIRKKIEETFIKNEERLSMVWAVNKIITIKKSVPIDMFYEWWVELNKYEIEKELFVSCITKLDNYFKLYSTRVSQSEELKGYTSQLDIESIKQLRDCLSDKEEWELTDEERYNSAIDYMVRYADEVKDSNERHRLLCEMLCGGIQQKFGIRRFITPQEIGAAYAKAHGFCKN